MIFALLCLIIPFILLIPRKWAARLIQAYLVLGALEWIITLMLLIGQRQSIGRDWTVSAIILGSVAALTFASAFIFQAKSLQERYKLGKQEPADSGEESDREAEE